MISVQDMTLIDEDLEPFWNVVSEGFHKLLWQPHGIKSSRKDSLSLSNSSNYQVDQSYYTKRMKPKMNSLPKNLLVSSKAISKIVDLKGLQSKNTLIVTKKIRIFPENESRYYQALHTYRLAYNLTVEALSRGEKQSSDLRRGICEKIHTLYSTDGNEIKDFVYDVNLIYEAYRKCTLSYNAQVKKFRKNGKPFKFSFMSWKYSPRYFMVQKLSRNGQSYPRQLGKVILSEQEPEESFQKSAVVKLIHGKWFLCTQKHVTCDELIDETSRICALDPGVRTFQTLYSENQAVKYGEGFMKDKILPVVLSISKWISKRDLFLGKFKDKIDTQYFRDMQRFFERKINKLRFRRDNLINDLHKQVAFDIVKNNDIILLPSFL